MRKLILLVTLICSVTLSAQTMAFTAIEVKVKPHTQGFGMDELRV